MRLGAHVSASGGVQEAPLRAAELGLRCFQYFSRPPQGGPAPKLSRGVIQAFTKNCAANNIESHFVHAPYIINLSSPNDRLRLNSVAMIRQDLKRASLLGSRGVIVHLGSSADRDTSQLTKRLVDSLRRVLDGYLGKALLLLENCAGAGNTIGRDFQELAGFLNTLDDDRVGICLDTAHAFAAGYDLRTAASVKRTLGVFGRTIGFKRLQAIHLNDSAADFQEFKDRHAHIGRGRIGLSGFKALLASPALKNLDLILETPIDSGRKADIRIVNSLIARSSKC
ncbi:MAG: deoxyribonuclease IV [Patescibacteria group bacterium]